MTDAEWAARAAETQRRVEQIARATNERQRLKFETASEAEWENWPEWLARRLQQSSPPPKITVTEELDYHVLCDEPPASLVAEIESRPEVSPGVKIVRRARRCYPQGNSAGNVLGYVGMRGEGRGAGDDNDYRADDWIGVTGVEKSCESILRGRSGVAVDMTEHGGRLLSSSFRRPPEVGKDVSLTLDLPLQQAAEELLDSAIERRRITHSDVRPAGGAIVVMDIADGALLALAAAPRFDPNLFAGNRSAEVAALLDDPAHPLFDRACRMAIPPGSVFKIVTAAALLESAAVDPEEPFFCQGYLTRPEERRCEIFTRQGIGHGETTLADALCVSCNVYFFHHAGRTGPEPLVEWAERLGFGRRTGVDLPGEAAGVVPSPANIARLEQHDWKTADTQASPSAKAHSPPRRCKSPC